MSITTYAELKTELAAWAHRDDLTAKLTDFIMLAEQPILRELKLRVNEAVATGTTTSNTITLPAGLGRIVRLEIDHDSHRYALDYVSPGIEDTTTALSRGYTVQDGAIRLIRAPAAEYSYSLHYIPNLTPLSDAEPTNWVLANSPDVYLYGSLVQLALYSQNDELSARFGPLYGGAMEKLKAIDEAKRFPASGGLQIKPRGYR